MYLKTPKRYSAKYTQRRGCRSLISFRWLWLYLLAPVVIVIAALAWDYRTDLSQGVGHIINGIPIPRFNAPTLTPTLPATDLKARIMQTLENGNIGDALDAMRAYTDSVPNEMTWHAVLAQTLIMRAHGDPTLLEQAQQAGLAAINANPEVPEGWLSYAMVLDWSDQSQKALSYALRAKDLGDANGMTSAVMAGIYFALGDVKQASTLIDESIKTNPNLAYAYFVKAQIAASQGAIKDAVSLTRQAWDISKADKTQWGGYIADQLAKFYAGQSMNQEDQAVALLGDAIQRDKDYPVLSARLGQIYYQYGQYDKSSEAAQRCLDLDKNYIACHILLMRFEYTAHQWEKAAQSAQRAIDLGSQETAPYYYGGLAYQQLNKCPEAIQLYNAGMVIAQKENNSQKKHDFTDALSACGVAGDVIIATQEATAAATAKAPTPARATATPKKR